MKTRILGVFSPFHCTVVGLGIFGGFGFFCSLFKVGGRKSFWLWKDLVNARMQHVMSHFFLKF